MFLKIVYKLLPVIYPLAQIYWRVFRPKTRGAVVIIRRGGQILLVRNTYGPRRWSLPGGGFESHESPEDGARREILEELGVRLGPLTHHGTFRYTGLGKRQTIWVFSVIIGEVKLNLQVEEIAATSWFDLNDLPRDTFPASRQALKLAHLI